MKTKIKLRKLDARGFSHDIGIVVFAVIFAIVGVGYLVASHADSCTPVSAAVSSSEGPVSGSVSGSCTPVSSPASSPVSTPTATGEQLSIPPARRPVQYVHRCSAPGVAEYDTQGTVNCLAGGKFLGNYAPTVPGTVYNVPCKTTNTNSVRYVYISTNEVCPAGSTRVVTTAATGEQLSIPPARRPVQYVHVCGIGKTVYVTQGTPNCLPGGIFEFNYAPSVPGTYYSIPCATTNGNSSNSTQLRYAYISSGEVCPAGTVLVSKN